MNKKLITIYLLLIPLLISAEGKRDIFRFRNNINMIVYGDAKDGYKYDFIPMLGFGYSFDCALTEKWFVHSGVDFSANSFDRFPDSRSRFLSLGYVTVPLYIGYNIPLSNRLSIDVKAGVSLWFNINPRVEYSIDAPNENAISSQYKADFIRKFTLSADASIRMSYYISRQISLFLDFGYSHSTNLIKKNPESFESYRKYNQAGYDIDRLNEADGIITEYKEAESNLPSSYCRNLIYCSIGYSFEF